MPLVYDIPLDEGIDGSGDIPDVTRLMRLWRACASETPDNLPRLSDISPAALPDLAPHLMLLEPVGGNYCYHHYGAAIIAAVGVDMTGRQLSDAPVPVPDFVRSRYDSCCIEQTPRLIVHRDVEDDQAVRWDRLLLPVAAADGTLRLVVFNKRRVTASDLLPAILESNPNGLLCLRPIRDAGGDIGDAHIVGTNRRVAPLIGRSDPGDLLGSRLSSVVPKQLADAIWERCRGVIETTREATFDTDLVGPGRVLRIIIAPIGDGLIVALNDITDLKTAHQTLQSQHANLVGANENLILLASELAVLAEEMEQSRRALAEEVKRRERLEERLRRMADTDSLTGIANRRCFLDRFANELMRSVRYDRPLSLIMMDIDHFKAINDRFGHATGDRVLMLIADTLIAGVRSSDHVARIGGEEFVVLLPETRIEDAVALAERLKRNIRKARLPGPETEIHITATFGVTERRPAETAIDGIMVRADAALYRGKALGRDRVIVAGEPGSPALAD